MNVISFHERAAYRPPLAGVQLCGHDLPLTNDDKARAWVTAPGPSLHPQRSLRSRVALLRGALDQHCASRRLRLTDL
jgi:hypothetical protein